MTTTTICHKIREKDIHRFDETREQKSGRNSLSKDNNRRGLECLWGKLNEGNGGGEKIVNVGEKKSLETPRKHPQICGKMSFQFWLKTPKRAKPSRKHGKRRTGNAGRFPWVGQTKTRGAEHATDQ